MAYIGKSPTGTGIRSRYYYTATGGETSLSGADDNGLTLVFSDGKYVDVSLNGLALIAGTEYNTNTANTISGLSALSASDVVEIVVYDIFTVADTVSAANGGTFSGNVVMSSGGSEVARFDSSGLSFDAGSNHLDDYEIGSWTLTPETNSGTAASIGTASGIYTRVGRLVTLIGSANNITPGGTSGSQLRIGGLPFSPANENSIGSATWQDISFQGSSTRFYLAPRARTAGYIDFQQCGENNSSTLIDHGDLDAGNTSDIEFTVTYMV